MKLKNIDIYKRMLYYKVHGLSITIINNGGIESSEGFGVLEVGKNHKVDSDSVFNACSISKFATSLLALKLVDDGILNLDENVNDRLTSWKVPENAFTQTEKVTLRRLLSHQGGFIDPDGSFSEYKSTQGIPTILDLLEGKKSYYPVAAEVKYEPGSQFLYSDMGFCIIEQLIEDVSKKPFRVLMNEMILQPLNMENSTLVYNTSEVKKSSFACGHNKDGKLVDDRYPIYPYPAAAGLWSTPTDLSSLVVELINSLKGNSQLGLSQKIITEMITPQGCSQWAGLGVFLDNAGDHLEISSLGWGVGFQCLMISYPHLGIGAVIMTNSDLGVHQTKGLIGEIVKSIGLQYGWPLQ